MLYLNRCEAQTLAMAETSSVCGYCRLPGDDPWAPAGNTDWVQWCGSVAQWNPHYGWATGCKSGEWIGTKIRSYRGTYQALACRLPD